MKKENKKIHKTSIGGQAVMEGVMMRGPKEIAIAVRKSDGEIVLDTKPVPKALSKFKWMKWPVIRGCISFFDSMILGVRSLMYSAEFVDIESEPEEQGKLDKWLEEKFGEKLKDYIIYFSVVFSLILSIGLFFVLPSLITDWLKLGDKDSTAKMLIDGGVRLTIFLIYLIAVSQMKDIKRVFMYHGAEHKSIHCYEAGEELTVENVRHHTRLHPRCGTSFLLIVMIVSIIIFLFVFRFLPNEIGAIQRVLLKILLLPLVAGISYEIIKFAGRKDNCCTRIISKPGMWLQYLTTREPDDSMLEVAITSLKAVIPENKEEDKW